MEVLRKAMLVGIGAMALTKDKLEQMVDQAVSRGEMSSEEGKSFINEAMQRADEQRDWLMGRVREETRRMMEGAGFATKEELAAVRVRLDALEAKLDTLIGSSGPAPESGTGLEAPEI